MLWYPLFRQEYFAEAYDSLSYQRRRVIIQAYLCFELRTCQHKFRLFWSHRFKCQICNQIFEKPSKLRLHKLKMHSKVQLLPSHSDFITKSEYKFKKHSKTNKFKTNKIFECCDIRFENAKAIKKHTCAYHPDG